MKSLILTVFMFFMVSAQADIEFDGKLEIPSEAEVSQNRACFEEVSKLGCGGPDDDHKHFRSCLHDVYPTLTNGCKKLMSGLYSKKNR